MSYEVPSISDFKLKFIRDFPYTIDNPDGVMDDDILNALDEAGITINEALFDSQARYTLGYLLLAAHILVTNLRASSQGLSGQYAFLQQSHGAGPVSESFSIPERVSSSPMLSSYMKTNYGAKFIIMVYPLLTGEMFAVNGGTRP